MLLRRPWDLKVSFLLALYCLILGTDNEQSTANGRSVMSITTTSQVVNIALTLNQDRISNHLSTSFRLCRRSLFERGDIAHSLR